MPRFLSKARILQLHADQIERYGGTHGIRDDGLLDSALAMPEAGFGDEYFHRDLYEMAAAYLFHLVSNHPFHDGNKRVGAAAGAVFLYLNGLQLVVDEDSFEALVFSVARGEADKPEIAAFFRETTRQRDRSSDPATD